MPVTLPPSEKIGYSLSLWTLGQEAETSENVALLTMEKTKPRSSGTQLWLWIRIICGTF